MGSSNIINKVKKGLAKAVNKTGSSSSEKVFLIQALDGPVFNTCTRTKNTPLSESNKIENPIELVDAIFKTYNKTFIDNENILAGDRLLVSNADVPIKQGDSIRQGSINYYVVSVDEKSPTSDTLLYISQLRLR